MVVGTFEAALTVARGDALRRGADAIAVIGGAEIYRAAMAQADRLEITEVALTPDGDVRFPAIDRSIWREAGRRHCPAGPADDAAFDLVRYVRADPRPTAAPAQLPTVSWAPTGNAMPCNPPR